MNSEDGNSIQPSSKIDWNLLFFIGIISGSVILAFIIFFVLPSKKNQPSSSNTTYTNYFNSSQTQTTNQNPFIATSDTYKNPFDTAQLSNNGNAAYQNPFAPLQK